MTDVIASGIITLRRWCRVEGWFLAGTKPIVGQKVRVYRIGELSYESPTPSWEATAITDAEGRFACDRVAAGRMVVDRFFPMRDGEGCVHGLATFIEVREGQITRISLSSPGRTVVRTLRGPEGIRSADRLDEGPALRFDSGAHRPSGGDVLLAREIRSVHS